MYVNKVFYLIKNFYISKNLFLFCHYGVFVTGAPVATPPDQVLVLGNNHSISRSCCSSRSINQPQLQLIQRATRARHSHLPLVNVCVHREYLNTVYVYLCIYVCLCYFSLFNSSSSSSRSSLILSFSPRFLRQSLPRPASPASEPSCSSSLASSTASSTTAPGLQPSRNLPPQHSSSAIVSHPWTSIRPLRSLFVFIFPLPVFLPRGVI